MVSKQHMGCGGGLTLECDTPQIGTVSVDTSEPASMNLRIYRAISRDGMR